MRRRLIPITAARYATRLYGALKNCGTAVKTLLVRTDKGYWRRVASAGVPSWDQRNEIIAAMIPANSSVVDLGCGARTLARYLKPGCIYQPFDVAPIDPAVAYCDFNNGIFPSLPIPADYVVCSGVLEYLWHPGEFLKKAAAMGRHVYLSYNPREPHESRRSRLGRKWVNHLSETDLERIFSEANLTVRLKITRPPTEQIFELDSDLCRRR